MIFINRLLAHIDLAIIKRSRIDAAEQQVKQFKRTLKKNGNSRKTLEELLLHTPVWHPAGFPQHHTQAALILFAEDIHYVSHIAEHQRHIRLEHIAIVDHSPEIPASLPITDANGSRSVPTGNLKSLAEHADVEFIFFQPEFSAQKYIAFSERLHNLHIRNAWYNATPPSKTVHIQPYYPHHFLTWKTLFKQLYQTLADEESRKTLAMLIKARTTGSLAYYTGSYYQQYLHPQIKISPGDYIIDAGALGINPAQYYSSAIGPEGKIWAFEPDPHAYAYTQKVLEGCSNVSLLQAAIWRTQGTMPFLVQPGGSSHLHPATQHDSCIEVQTFSIDDIVQEYSIRKVDLIKMNIQGAELAALEGAKETLRHNSPNLVIAVHHTPTNLIEIPEFIKKLNLGYKIYLGHHSATAYNTIVYASAR